MFIKPAIGSGLGIHIEVCSLMEKMFFAQSCNICMDKFRKEPKTQIKDKENFSKH